MELVEPQLNYTYTGMDEDNGNIQWPAPKGMNPTCECCFWVTRLPDIASGITNNHKRTLTEIYSSGGRSAAECSTRGTWPDMSLPTQREEVEGTGITAALLETLSSSSLTQNSSKPLCSWVLWGPRGNHSKYYLYYTINHLLPWCM